MKRFSLVIISLLFSLQAWSQDGFAGETFLRPLAQTDSITVGDQFRYGFRIEGSPEGASYLLPDLSKGLMDGVAVLSPWRVDSLGVKEMRKSKKKSIDTLSVNTPVDIEMSVVIAPFVDVPMVLPALGVQRTLPAGDSVLVDTLWFSPQALDVRPIQIDTANFVIRDIKGQIRYPVTVQEIIPWVLGGWLIALIIALIVCLIINARRKDDSAGRPAEPAYIVALRGLEKYRGNKYWAPEQQKAMYSGITDTLRTYIESRFDVNAEEMTTAEIFATLDGDPAIPADILAETKSLFELSDFVKFARYTASDDDNARAIPGAVRFVTSTIENTPSPAADDVKGSDKAEVDAEQGRSKAGSFLSDHSQGVKESCRPEARELDNKNVEGE